MSSPSRIIPEGVASDAMASGDAESGAAAIVRGMAALTAWSATLDLAAVPEAVLRRAAQILADDLAAIVAARDEPELEALHDGLAASSGPAEATVFDGRGRRLDRYSAATANACAADWCELDEGYRRAMCHAGLYCLPALLAEAEATGATGGDLLRALVIGYETATRVARAFPFPVLTLHPHGAVAAIGAAASVAALRRRSAEQAAAAISSAATMVLPGPFDHAVQGALVRNVWPGVGAWVGLRAVDWAGFGITGRAASLHDVYAVALGADVRAGALTAALGEEWAMADGYHKLHACCQYAHSAVEASLALLARRPEGAAGAVLRRIRIDTHPPGRRLDNPHPATTLAAKFSLQHILAATAHFGHAGAEAFHASTLADPDIARLRGAVSIGDWEPVPEWPNDRPARVVWELDDGTTLSEECLSARGGPDRPLTPSDLREKVHGIVARPYPAMPAVLDGLLALDPGLLEQAWDRTVARMTEGAPGG